MVEVNRARWMMTTANDAKGTRDPREIARFNALAADWWNPDGPMKPLHRMNPVRLAFIRREAQAALAPSGAGLRPFVGLSVLDVGCGAGLLAEPLARMGFSVTGIDLAADAIAAAQMHAEAEGLAIDYRVAALEELPADPAHDCITLLEILEHVPDPSALIAAAARRLRPGGLLIASTLSRTVKSHLMAIIGAEYLLRWLPIGTHDWSRFITPEEMETAFHAAGLEQGISEGMVFNPFSGGWSLSGDRDVHYIAAALKHV